MLLSGLRHASFRGVRFHLDEAVAGYEPRKKVHEFFGSNDFKVEDLCRGPRRFPVEGYLVGKDYDLSRDLLFKAAEKEGPGKLVHPSHGMIDVICMKLVVSENFRERDYVRIRFEFIEAPKPTSGLPELTGVGDLIKAADDAFSAAALDFMESFSVVAMPAYVAESAAALLNRAADFMTSANGFGLISEATNDAARAVSQLKADIPRLLRSPLDLALSLRNATLALGSALPLREIGSAIASINGELEKLPLPPPLTPSRKRERTNHEAILAITRRSLVVSAASTVVAKVDSQAERLSGTALREITANLRREIDLTMSATKDSAVFQTIHQLKATLDKLLENANTSLALYHVRRHMPALVLSYELAGTLDAEPIITSVNDLPHPGFIAANTLIEVPRA